MTTAPRLLPGSAGILPAEPGLESKPSQPSRWRTLRFQPAGCRRSQEAPIHFTAFSRSLALVRPIGSFRGRGMGILPMIHGLEARATFQRLLPFAALVLLLLASFPTGLPAAPKSSGDAGAAPVHADRFDNASLETLVFECVNIERKRHGLRAFTPDSALRRAALAHSSDMASRGYFSHDSKRGFMRSTDFGDRLRANGVSFGRMAENIAMLPLVKSRMTTRRTDERGRPVSHVQEDRTAYRELAQNAVRQWMESPGHRKNILSPALDTMGIGAALGKRDREDYVYLTQDFGGR